MLSPKNFEPFDNLSIEEIRLAGGQVVRVDDSGEFATTLNSGTSYQLLIISYGKTRRSAEKEISKEMRAELGTFFFPLEELIEDHDFHWQSLSLEGKRHELPVVMFE